jgi:diguanylate cyclase (GGDEF)-like protein
VDLSSRRRTGDGPGTEMLAPRLLAAENHVLSAIAAEAGLDEVVRRVEDLLHGHARSGTGRVVLGRGGAPGGGASGLVAPVLHAGRRAGEVRLEDRKALEDPDEADGADCWLLERAATLVAHALRREEVLEAMWRLATHDALTGLPSRALLLSQVTAALRQRPSDPEVALLVIDLGAVQAVNERFGRTAGDRLLAAVAGRVVACLRSSDVAGRLVGDELAVLLLDARAEEAAQVATRLLDALRIPVDVGGEEVTVEARVGVATARAGDDAEALLGRADRALAEGRPQPPPAAVLAPWVKRP